MQREVEQQMAEAEIKGLRDEIERLQHQLRAAQCNVDVDLDHSPLPLVPANSVDYANRASQRKNSESEWSLTFGLWDYFFSPSEKNSQINYEKAIIRV